MIFTEGFQALVKWREAKEAEATAKTQAAFDLERSATVDYLFRSMLLSEYKKILERTSRLTKPNFRKFASRLKLK